MEGAATAAVALRARYWTGVKLYRAGHDAIDGPSRLQYGLSRFVKGNFGAAELLTLGQRVIYSAP